MKKGQRVLALDLDGTLIQDNNNDIHPQDVALLRAGLPLPLILATGRSLLSTRFPFIKNGLVDGKPLPYPLVLNNGGLLYGPNEALKAQKPFSAEVARELIRIASLRKNTTFLIQGIPDPFQLGESEDGVKALRKYGYFTQTYQPEHHSLPITKVMALSARHEELEEVAAAFAHLPIEGNFSLDDIYEVTPLGVNKGKGLTELLGILDWQDAELFVAGDGENDACMFSIADRSFAPINGRDFIREMADQVIDPRPRGLLTPILEQIL